MIVFKMQTVGGAGALQRFLGAPGHVKERILAALYFIGGELEDKMRQKASQLHRKTGKLERGFYHLVRTKDGGNVFVLRVGVNRRAFYAAFQDKGVPRKSVDVRNYTRGNKRGDVRKRGARASGVAFVKAYQREMFLNPKPFIGVSFEQMRNEIMAELRTAVRGGIGS